MKNKVIILLLLVVLAAIFPACSSTSSTPLPQSMKGYELYSWQEESQWHFTLITGTNRNKTLEEITTGETKEGEEGWVNIHVTGVATIKDVLNRIPENEFIIWNTGNSVLPTEQAILTLIFPPRDMVNEIMNYAMQCGLDFIVPMH
jgi:hypothetical protein